MSATKYPETDLPAEIVNVWGVEAAAIFEEWLERKLVSAHIAPKAEISPSIARRKINVLMLERVSNQLVAGEPSLQQNVAGEWVWQVPVELGFIKYGRVGKVGQVDVNAQSGMIYFDDIQLKHIGEKARELAAG
ncbi:MAG: hypothetical protein R3A44_27145 [Caldilineaceae bacterium]